MRRSRFVLALSGLSTLMAAVGIGVAHSAERPSPRPSAESNERPADGRSPRSKVMKKITIRGVCRDERGTPVTDARVRVFRYPSRLETPLLVADLRADEGGKFVAEEIATAIDDADFGQTGDVCVAVTAERHVSTIRWINQETLLEAVPAIDPFEPRASNRRNTDVIDLLLELRGSPGTISGTVTDESGRAISGVRVFLPSVFQQPLPDIRSAVTDEAGRYSIADLNPWPTGEDISSEERTVVTSIVFLLDHPDYARTVAHYTAVPQTVNITLHPPAILEGAVVDAVAQRPAANVIVSAQGVARSGWYQTRTDRQGRYRLRMTKDHYNIWAEADDRIPIAAKAIKAEPGKTVSVADIPLVRGGFVTGQIIDPATNKPVAPPADSPLRVAHYGPARPRTGAAVTSTEVNADGTYRLRVAPGINYIYLMNGGGAQIVSVDDGQELNVDLGAGNRANRAGNTFADDLQLAATLRKEAQIEDAKNGGFARGVVAEPMPKPAGRQRGDTPVARLLDKLEAQDANGERFKDSWLRTLKEIVDIGPSAVPELIAELDATENDPMLRCLGFTLRAIGDKRAMPALIRAIPKTLRPPGSDMGLRTHDAELLKFAQQHDLDAQDRDGMYSFGRPVREIFGAVQKLSGEKHGEEQLFHIFLDGLPSQRRMKRELYQRIAEEWADLWQKNWEKQVHDAAYARVNLRPLVAAEANAPPPPGMHFKVDSGGSGWVLESVLNPKSKTVFYDFDTGRVSDLPEKWRGAKNIEPLLDEIIAWARQEGFDLMGTEYVSPNGGPSVFALRSIGLHAWELGDHRWKMQSGDITLEDLQAEGTPADDLLLHRDKESKAIDPQAIASFLCITREGTPGLLFVGIEVQDDSLQPGGRMQGDVELQPIAFRKGRRFGFKNFTERK